MVSELFLLQVSDMMWYVDLRCWFILIYEDGCLYFSETDEVEMDFSLKSWIRCELMMSFFWWAENDELYLQKSGMFFWGYPTEMFFQKGIDKSLSENRDERAATAGKIYMFDYLRFYDSPNQYILFYDMFYDMLENWQQRGFL